MHFLFSCHPASSNTTPLPPTIHNSEIMQNFRNRNIKAPIIINVFHHAFSFPLSHRHHPLELRTPPTDCLLPHPWRLPLSFWNVSQIFFFYTWLAARFWRTLLSGSITRCSSYYAPRTTAVFFLRFKDDICANLFLNLIIYVLTVSNL